MLPFADLSFNGKELSVILSALDSFQSVSLDGVSRKQDQTNKALAKSALQKINSQILSFNVNELRIIYVALGCYSLELANVEELEEDEAFIQEVEKMQFITTQAIFKVKALLSQLGIVIDAI